MDRDDAEAVIEQLHAAQARLYTDGDPSAVRAVLTPDIAWHVPGGSPIAGSYRGLDEVVSYMLARRALADGTFRMHRLDVLTGEGSTVAVLTDGTATIDGVDRRWSTVGLYRVEEGRVAECWLLPLDQAEFDDIWTPRGGA
jgi:ketosteroid isomerase-like protein